MLSGETDKTIFSSLLSFFEIKRYSASDLVLF